ncbi:hypothetical protein KAR91_04710 [Candidatus Pacearchaeota archaeon]|nr:hypothetical protein [Candidatus Pacearchaeota archaeon]
MTDKYEKVEFEDLKVGDVVNVYDDNGPCVLAREINKKRQYIIYWTGKADICWYHDCNLYTYERQITATADKWVDVKDWSEFEEGDKILSKTSGEKYEITTIGTGKYDLNVQDKWGRTGLGFEKQQFGSNDWQRLETTATEEEAPTGGWVPVKDWSELRVGMKVKRTGRQQGGYLDGILKITYVDHEKFEHSKGGQDCRTNWKNGFYTFEKRAEAPTPTNQYQTLEKVFVNKEPDHTPKKISNHPHKCLHCGSPSYNAQYYIDCTGNCAKSKS